MIGYIFILITVFLDTLKGGCSKKLSTSLNCLADNINLCFVRNTVCVVLGYFIILASGGSLHLPAIGWIICFFYGVGMTVNYMTWLMVLKSDAYMLANATVKSSFVIAVVFGIFLFGERFTLAKFAAFLLIVAALYFMMRYQVKQFKKPGTMGILLLVAVFLSAGLNSVCQKAFTSYLPECSPKLLTFYTFVISCAILAFLRPFFKAKACAAVQAKNIVRFIPYILIMGTALYGATFFQTAANKYADAVILYPLNSALSVISASIMSWAVFGERPSRDSIAGAFLVVAALVLSRF